MDLAAVAERFGLGAGTVSLVDEAATGTTYRLMTSKGSWLLTRPADWILTDGADADVRLATAARDAGIPTHRPVPSLSGDYVERIGDDRWRVPEWLDLGPPVTLPATADEAAAMAELLTELHELAPPTDRPLPPWLTERPSDDDWDRLRSAAEGTDWVAALDAAIPVLTDVATIATDHQADDVVLCHSNLIPGNLRHAGRAGLAGLAVTGWEHTGALLPRWERGYVLSQWATLPDGTVDTATAAALGGPGLDESALTVAITSTLNWTISRAWAALESAEAVAEAVSLLRAPMSRERIERLLTP